MASGNKLYALCVLVLVLAASGLPVCTASRKLLQRGGGGGGGGAAEATNTFNTNSVRAQAATSQAITETVNNGGGLPNTRRAGNVGVATGWAAGQQNNIFTQTDYASSPGRAGPVGSNAGTNTVTGSRGPADTAGTRFGTLTTSDTSLVSSLDVRPGRTVG